MTQQNSALFSESMDVFMYFAQTKSLSLTAKHFSRSHSSISRQIHKLEDTLGVDLVMRARRPMTLTREGLKFYHAMNKQFLGIEDILTAIKLESNIKPELRIGFLESFVSSSVDFITQLEPHTNNIICLSGTTDRLQNLFHINEVDMVLTSDSFEAVPNIKKKRLLSETSALVLPRRLCQNRPDNRWNWEKLSFSGIPYLKSSKLSRSGRSIETFFTTNNMQISHRIEIDSVSSKLELIARGLGWALIPATSLYQNKVLLEERLKNDIAILPAPAPNYVRHIYLISNGLVSESLFNVSFEATTHCAKNIQLWLESHFPLIRDNLTIGS